MSGNVFPGATACVGYREKGRPVYVTAAAGRLERGGAAADPRSLYDLASLTKPFVATAALRMCAAGALDMEVKAEDVLTDIRGGVSDGAPLSLLFRHRAGLAAWGGFYLDVPHEIGSAAARRWILGEAARRPDGTRGECLYSDLGYMLAGEVIARRAKTTLDRVVERFVTVPLGIDDDVYFAAASSGARRAALAGAAPTERCEWRERVIRGEVHDENCAALGGVSGHAGLFGRAEGVARFGRAMLDSLSGHSEFLPAAQIEAALADPGDGGHYRLGWDRKSGPESASGRRSSDQTFGHLGFTGTSIWCDPVRDLVVVLLSNRVHPSRANEKIRQFRPAFHDGLFAVMDT